MISGGVQIKTSLVFGSDIPGADLVTAADVPDGTWFGVTCTAVTVAHSYTDTDMRYGYVPVSAYRYVTNDRDMSETMKL